MTRDGLLRFATTALPAICMTVGLSSNVVAQTAASQAAPAKTALKEAAAAGAAGALFSVAKSRLKADEFAQVAKAVPGMDALLKAAPSGAGSAASSAMSSIPGAAGTTGSAQGLASAAASFSKLGLQPDMVSKAVPVLTSMVTKSGGADVGKLLAGALK